MVMVGKIVAAALVQNKVTAGFYVQRHIGKYKRLDTLESKRHENPFDIHCVNLWNLLLIYKPLFILHILYMQGFEYK